MKELALNAKSTEIFNLIVDKIEACEKKYITLDSENGYMPLSAEKLYEYKIGTSYALAHYGKQNGDMMADPSMEFIKTLDGLVFPMSFQNDYAGFYNCGIEINKDGQLLIKAILVDDQKEFAQMWLKNIKEQQNL